MRMELIVVSRKEPIKVELNNGTVSVNEIKSLGVNISCNLTWDSHVAKTITNISRIIGAIRSPRTLSSALKVVASQYFGTGCSITPVISHGN